MSESDFLLSSWLDRRLNGDELARLSTRLAHDPGLADELAEMTSLDQALDVPNSHAPPVVVRARRSRNMALVAAAAVLVVAGVVGLWRRPTEAPRTASDAPQPPVSVVGQRPAPGVLPRPPRSQDERAQASLDRFLRRHPIARRSYTEATLRDIAAECLELLQQKQRFQGTMDLTAAGTRAETLLTFSKPAGSLRGLLLHASALAGCTPAIHPSSISFVPIPGSPTKQLTKHITAAPEAHESVRNFCATGTLPPVWGLPPSEFQATPQPDGSLELIATEWRLAQLELVIDAMDTPLLTVDVTVCALPSSAEGLEKIGLEHIIASLTKEQELPVLAVAAVLTQAQWESMKPALIPFPDSVLTEFTLPVISGQWVDLGDHAPGVLRWDTQSLGLKGVLGSDELTFDLEIGRRFVGADPATKSGLSTSITIWPGLYLLLGYTDAAAPPESRHRGLVIRVEPLE